MADEERLPIAEVLPKVGKNFARVTLLKGSSYKNRSTAVIIPTLGLIHHRVVTSLVQLISPQNQPRTLTVVKGEEVGEAYNIAIERALNDEPSKRFKYIMTVEDDNIVPFDANIRLIESMEKFDAEAVSGLYFSKGEFGFPMAFGDPEKWRQDGYMDMNPREDIGPAVEKGQVIEVNGIAMGCALWRMDLFREFKPPWFVTYQSGSQHGCASLTQDIYFSEQVRRAGGRLYVDTRVRVGHIDMKTGIIY
jgi:hypothetical protein